MGIYIYNCWLALLVPVMVGTSGTVWNAVTGSQGRLFLILMSNVYFLYKKKEACRIMKDYRKNYDYSSAWDMYNFKLSGHTR